MEGTKAALVGMHKFRTEDCYWLNWLPVCEL